MGLVAALSGLLVKALGRIATAAFGRAATLRSVARLSRPPPVVPSPGRPPRGGDEAAWGDARSLGMPALTIVANALLVVGSVAPRLAKLAGRTPGPQRRRRAG